MLCNDAPKCEFYYPLGYVSRTISYSWLFWRLKVTVICLSFQLNWGIWLQFLTAQPTKGNKISTASLQRSKTIFLCFSPDRTWHKVKWSDGRIIVWVRVGEGRTLAEGRALLLCAGHRLTLQWTTKFINNVWLCFLSYCCHGYTTE